jgi:myosin heavy subunit
MVVSVNPFKKLPIYSDDLVKKYQEASEISSLPPHLYTIPKAALDHLRMTGESQSIIISGTF